MPHGSSDASVIFPTDSAHSRPLIRCLYPTGRAVPKIFSSWPAESGSSTRALAPSLSWLPGGHQNRVVRFELPDIGQLTAKALQLERPDTLAAGESLCHRHRFVHRRLVAQGDQGLDLSGALPDLPHLGCRLPDFVEERAGQRVRVDRLGTRIPSRLARVVRARRFIPCQSGSPPPAYAN